MMSSPQQRVVDSMVTAQADRRDSEGESIDPQDSLLLQN